MTTHDKELKTKIAELTDEQRLDARERAAAVLLREIGDKPQREQYEGMTVSEYPASVRSLVTALMVVVFVAAALPSLFRLYDAGRVAHFDMTANLWQARMVGLSTFVLAEFLIITSTLAISIYAKRVWQKVLFLVAIVMGLLVAFVGNWTQVQPDTLFKWLETIAPPLTVVVMSFVGERLVMDGVKKAHADEKAYQEALAQHQDAVRDIESHKRWHVTYGRALATAIRNANSTKSGRGKIDDYMNGLTRRDWRVLVNRELSVERGDWLTAPDSEEPEPPQEAKQERPFGSTPTAPDARANMPRTPNGNGHIAAANGA